MLIMSFFFMGFVEGTAFIACRLSAEYNLDSSDLFGMTEVLASLPLHYVM